MNRWRRRGTGMLLLTLACLPLAAQVPIADPAPGLPPTQDALRALQDSPRLQIAAEYLASGQARAQRLAAGPHEWEVDVLSQQRRDVMGSSHLEQEYGLQTGVRWPWKYSLDRRLGALARETGELAYFDAWHEAGRNLLDLWFAWVHAQRQLGLLDAQVATMDAQRDAVARRVTAGDAAALELRLAEAETQRLRAARSAAQRNVRVALEELAREFPALSPTPPTSSAAPPELPGEDASWMASIVADNHEIELAQARRDEANLAADRAARERFADPVLGLRYTNNLGGEQRVIGLSFRLPLGGAGRAADAALARSAARVADGEARRTGDRVAAAARTTVADARQSFASWQQLQAALAAQQAAAEAAARGYALGEFDLSMMLAARRGALDAEQQLLEALLRAQWSYARVLLDAHRLWPPPEHGGRQ